eukprot:TRINITY_DN11031_c0_g1_i2.p1 TRINITY_DN11031_c0_g1~~TRINITY_DN11031_c0_g1_i2.p1  ORF type:complete len:310 (+),score=21.93 TRINITY_DN11031_c0_g1_i2:479-1408(+)
MPDWIPVRLIPFVCPLVRSSSCLLLAVPNVCAATCTCLTSSPVATALSDMRKDLSADRGGRATAHGELLQEVKELTGAVKGVAGHMENVSTLFPRLQATVDQTQTINNSLTKDWKSSFTLFLGFLARYIKHPGDIPRHEDYQKSDKMMSVVYLMELVTTEKQEVVMLSMQNGAACKTMGANFSKMITATQGCIANAALEIVKMPATLVPGHLRSALEKAVKTHVSKTSLAHAKPSGELAMLPLPDARLHTLDVVNQDKQDLMIQECLKGSPVQISTGMRTRLRTFVKNCVLSELGLHMTAENDRVVLNT